MGRFTDFLTNLLVLSISDEIEEESKKLQDKGIWTKKDDEKVAVAIKDSYAKGQKIFEANQKTMPRDPDHVRVDALIASLGITIDDTEEITPAQQFLIDRNKIKSKTIKALVKLGIAKKEAKDLTNEVLLELGEKSTADVQELIKLALTKAGK